MLSPRTGNGRGQNEGRGQGVNVYALCDVTSTKSSCTGSVAQIRAVKQLGAVPP